MSQELPLEQQPQQDAVFVNHGVLTGHRHQTLPLTFGYVRSSQKYYRGASIAHSRLIGPGGYGRELPVHRRNKAR
jgi:hypothetical protein